MADKEIQPKDPQAVKTASDEREADKRTTLASRWGRKMARKLAWKAR